jgi:hypothetical protein
MCLLISPCISLFISTLYYIFLPPSYPHFLSLSLSLPLSTARDVSNSAMKAHDVSGLWRLSVLTSLLALVPVPFLWLLPQSTEEQANLSNSSERSKIGGAVFLFVLFGSLGWTFLEAIMELVSVWHDTP